MRYNHTKTIAISQIIDDYNYWMLETDLVDQFIAYYWPKIWYQQRWITIILNCLDVLHINIYVLHKDMCKRPVVEEKDNGHKEFLLDFINLLIRRSIVEHNT